MAKVLKKKLLIIDDDLIATKAHRYYLGKEYYINFMIDGQSAINHLNETDIIYNLFILDITLPDINGVDLAVKIKNLMHPNVIPTIFISANNIDDLQVKTKIRSNYTIFKKPVDIKNFKFLIDKILQCKTSNK